MVSAGIDIITGDCLEVLPSLPEGAFHTCVTSPPYFGLRDYGAEAQIGLEPSPEEYVAALVNVFRLVRRALRDDGTLWLNLGDSYAGGGNGGGGSFAKDGIRAALHGTDKSKATRHGHRGVANGLKPKDLVGIPWRVAFALQADGWYLRQWLPWVKRNSMPESTKDRPTVACETVFMLTKRAQYFYDYDAVRRKMAPSSAPRLDQDIDAQAGSKRANGGGKTNGAIKAVGGDKQRGHSRRHAGFNARWDAMEKAEQCRNGRSFRNADLFFDSLDAPHGAIASGYDLIALDVATQGFSGAHFAVMPPRLIEPLVIASCPAGGAVLDPFGGAGTTGLVAARHGRRATLVEVNPDYATMARERIDREWRAPRRMPDDADFGPLFTEVGP